MVRIFVVETSASTTLNYCKPCTKIALAEWQGWPHRDHPIPFLVALTDNETCNVCSSNETVSNEQINWVNYHSAYSTGLPDYWLLQIDAEEEYKRWGKPYSGQQKCLSCDNSAIISEHKPTPSKTDIAIHCYKCITIRRHRKR